MNLKLAFNKTVFYINVIILLLLGIIFFSNFYTASRDTKLYNDGPVWNVYLPDGRVFTDVDLSKREIHCNLRPTETLVLETELDPTYRGDLTARILTRESGLRVFLNDDEIFRYKVTEPNDYAGTGYHFVSIPISFSKRTLHVELLGRRGRAADAMPEIVITRTKDAYAYFLDQHIFIVHAAIFLLVFGIILTLFSLVSYAIDEEYDLLLIIGFIGVLSGMWSVSNTKAVELLSMDIALNSFFEYVSLYLLPIPVLLFIERQHSRDNRSSVTVRMAIGMSATFATLALVMHLSGIVYVSQVLHIYHAMVAIILVMVLLGRPKNPRRMEKYEIFYLAAFITALVFIFFCIIRFQYQRVAAQATSIHSFLQMIPGLLLFVLFLFVGYLSYMNTRIVSRAEREVLENLAYKDAMTGLCNRAHGERMMRELSLRENSKPFAIVNFDLNGLKRTNDSLGHFAGDDMLCRFAEILTKCFASIGTPVRMSGDEFIVIVEGADNMGHIDSALRQLVALEREASEEADYVLDASYGVARSVEFLQPNAEMVYQAADYRMYEMKEASKKGRE